MTYRIKLRVPSSYTDEARMMIDDHPRAAVVERLNNESEQGADLLVIISSEPQIMHGLHRWWMDRCIEWRANPPLAILRPDDSPVTFNDHTAAELEEFGRRDEVG